MIPGSASPFFLGSSLAAATPGGLQIARSLRCNSADSAYLSRTPAVTGNRKTWTWAGWVKLGKLGTTQRIFKAADTYLSYYSTTGILYTNLRGASTNYFISYANVYRDPSAWYHIVLAVDTTQSTASNRQKLYVNGVQLTDSGSLGQSYPPQNDDTGVNSNSNQHEIAGDTTDSLYFDGYLANIHFIDGQQLTPSSFTETDATTGQLIPKTYTGSYGTNGFNLLFADNSSNTASTLGKDTSGLGNNWTPNNFSVVSGTGVVTVPTTNAPPTVDYLVVAGGGGGGSNDSTSNRASGGGGAGGFRNANGFSVTSGTQYTVTVGAAGAGAAGGGSAANGTNGGDSVFGNITSAGGGGGGGARGNIGSNGGSGGGGGDNGGGGGLGNTPATSPSQGSNGGAAGGVGIAGGGGGASTAGTTLAGGTGTASSISGSSVTYSTGGQPGQTTPATGTANTGNGGGGNFGSNTSGYSGGSGIVILRYANTYDDLIVGSGLTYTYANTGGYKIYSFTASATAAQSAGNDSLVDSPTNYGTDTYVGGEVRGNYCTLNPLQKNTSLTISNGNLDAVGTGSNQSTYGTIGVSSGKWYWEVLANGGMDIGIANASGITLTTYVGSNASSYAYDANGNKYNNGSGSAYGASFTTNDVIGVAFDADNGTLTFYKNGTSQGQAFSSLTSGPYFPAFSTATASYSANFGQRAFAYTAPSGFKALCTTNLPAPLVTKSNEVFDVLTWTGNGASSRSLTGLNFSPDFAWIKRRNSAAAHTLWDSVRGLGSNKELSSSDTAAEGTTVEAVNYGYVSALNSNGLTVNTGAINAAYVNANSDTYVGWTWDAGTSTVSNTQGSITSQVRANATAGFSVVTYTGTLSGSPGTAPTVGHGLGVAPRLIISKSRTVTGDENGNWYVNHAYDYTKYLRLNGTGAELGITANGGGTTADPTSSVFSTYYIVGSNTSGNNYIAYCFAPVVGYSNGFSYTGNGSADGSFVYLGFRPRLIMLKRSDSTSNWTLLDTSREGYNVDNDPLYPNTSDAEGTADLVDITSNGFKLRTTDASVNASAGTYIGFAWAEMPFNYSRAR